MVGALSVVTETNAPMDQKPLKITALRVADVAKVLASASGREVTEEQVQGVAERGDLIRSDGTISLLEYAAFLLQESVNGTSKSP